METLWKHFALPHRSSKSNTLITKQLKTIRIIPTESLDKALAIRQIALSQRYFSLRISSVTSIRMMVKSSRQFPKIPENYFISYNFVKFPACQGRLNVEHACAWKLFRIWNKISQHPHDNYSLLIKSVQFYGHNP